MRRSFHRFIAWPALCAAALVLPACGGGGGGGQDVGVTGQPPVAPPPGDVSAPTVEILSPTTAAEFDAQLEELALAGVAADDAGLAEVRWSTSRGASGTAIGLEQWQVNGIPLAAGTTVVEVTAADTSGNEVTDRLSVTWDPDVNHAPVIGGAPPLEVLKDEAYDFRPDAQDADGDPLRFEIANQPTWAAFDSATGRLWGTPGAADVGRYEGVVIGVSDGVESTALPAFSIDVLESGLFSISLSWIAPTERTDGSPLTNLGGYYIYYGEDSIDEQVQVDNPGITAWTLDELAAGTYRITMSAYDQNGIEGERSATLEVRLGG